VAHTLQHLSEAAVKALAGSAVIQSSGAVTLDCLGRVVGLDCKKLELALHELECSGLMNVAVDQDSGTVTYSVAQMAVVPTRELARKRGWEASYTDNLKRFLRERGGDPPRDSLLRELLEIKPQGIRAMLDYEKQDLLQQLNRVRNRFPAYDIELAHLEAELHRQLGNLTTADDLYGQAADKVLKTPEKLGKERYQALLLEAATVAKQAGATTQRLNRAVGYLEKILNYQTGALRVSGMLAEFSGILGEGAKFNKYAERVRRLVQERNLTPNHPQRIQAEAAVERGRDALKGKGIGN
jgi:hypothetical protein